MVYADPRNPLIVAAQRKREAIHKDNAAKRRAENGQAMAKVAAASKKVK